MRVLKKKKIPLIVFLLIAGLVFFNYRKTLSFSLAGDDWLALYRYYIAFPTRLSYFNLNNYLGNYDASNIIVGEISRFFGFNPFPYYFVSTIVKILSAISFIPTIKKLTKNNFAAYLSAILVAVAFAGVESTNWVFNMSTYFSIALFNLFLYFYEPFNGKIFNKKIIIPALLMSFSFYLTPIRIHGLLVVLPITIYLLHKLNSNKKGVNLVSVVAHSVLFLFPSIYFYSVTATRYGGGYLENILAIPKLKPHLFFLPFSYLGAAFIPDKAIMFFKINLSRPDLLSPEKYLTFAGSFLLISLIITELIKRGIKAPKQFTFLTTTITAVVYLLFGFTLKYDTSGIYHNIIVIIDTLVGIYILVAFTIFFAQKRKANLKVATTGFIYLISTCAVIWIPWIVFPSGTVHSDTRYLLLPGAYLLVCLSLVLSQFIKKKSFLLFLIVCVFLVANTYSLNSYFNTLTKVGRPQVDHIRVAKEINSAVPVLDTQASSAYLFTGPDDEYIYYTIRFGFPYYMLLTHKELNLNFDVSPFPVDNFQSLQQIYNNPNSEELKRYGYEGQMIAKDHVYSFYIDKYQVTNKTNDIRVMLK